VRFHVNKDYVLGTINLDAEAKIHDVNGVALQPIIAARASSQHK
jgi:hypothetical protein